MAAGWCLREVGNSHVVWRGVCFRILRRGAARGQSQVGDNHVEDEEEDNYDYTDSDGGDRDSCDDGEAVEADSVLEIFRGIVDHEKCDFFAIFLNWGSILNFQ